MDAGLDAGPLVDAYLPPDAPPGEPPGRWCDQLAPGAPGAREPALDLSEAYALVRLFGPEPGLSPESPYAPSSLALAAALEGADALSPSSAAATVEAFAGALASACAFPAGPQPELGPAAVELRGGVALVRPGLGSPAIPREAEAIALDLRELPSSPSLWGALERAASASLEAPVARLPRERRVHLGQTDELASADNVFSEALEVYTPAPIPAGLDRRLPLALLTGPRLTPEAAELALTLRLAGRAWLLGEDVMSGVAEARLVGVGEAGLASPIRSLLDEGGALLPDRLEADARSGEATLLLEGLALRGDPPPIARGVAERPRVAAVDGFRESYAEAQSLGIFRASLIVTHAILRRFFPYFEEVGDRIDGRLLELLAEAEAADPSDRGAGVALLERMSEALRDGHAVASAFGYPPPSTCLPLLLERLGGEVVVRASGSPSVAIGDALLSLDGRPVEELLDAIAPRISGASEGYRFELAQRRLVQAEGPTLLELRAADGGLRSQSLDPVSCRAVPTALETPAAGFLGALGAPSIYYLDLDRGALPDTATFRARLLEAAGAAGLILDMRGYPRADHVEMARRLLGASFLSPIYRTPRWRGADELDEELREERYEPLADPSYAGPIALLIGPRAISAAENFAAMMAAEDRVRRIGRPTGATNGNLTFLLLPGGYFFVFTGVRVRGLFGEPFHGVGVLPDLAVEPTPAALSAGRDPLIEAAIDHLAGL